ncbi:dockerin type I domain-containing protein [Gloeobacter violaceus]|uniref:Glr0059 protein n=1 Tax=Gloeobacter violaceus (strain ATCC 29082 / PCC 7421) TaxID=251221 RepID=Q7NPJ6_GLOVI|nr:dockerin type I domain-containing protein [Gloeobacter violaceus]BAC88000.1 glr0059 [Gloeobacter violaceus PCC 7421]
MRRIVFLFVCLGVWTAGAAARAASGDVNGDGRVDAGDIRLIDEYLGGTRLLQDEQIKAADADGDGQITATDREMLDRRVSGLAAGSAAPGRSASRGQVDLTSADGGVVVDKATGRPLAGVEVSLPDEKITVRTDAQGRFRLPGTASGKILSARAENYVPSSVTTRGQRGFQLQLERLNPRVQVLDDELVHLGDNNYDRRSAGARQFQAPAAGTRYTRTFALGRLPGQDLQLRIGSLIGIDTEESIAAGQSNLPAAGRREQRAGGVKVRLNGRIIGELLLGGDDIAIALPRQLLRPGANEIALEAALINRSGVVIEPDSFLGKMRGLGLGDMALSPDSLDYDDIEFTHLVIVDPSGKALERREP